MCNKLDDIRKIMNNCGFGAEKFASTSLEFHEIYLYNSQMCLNGAAVKVLASFLWCPHCDVV